MNDDANPDVAANRTLTLTNDVTIQQGVTLTVGVTVKNLFNRLPYYDPNDWMNFPSSYTNNFGRIYSVTATYKF